MSQRPVVTRGEKCVVMTEEQSAEIGPERDAAGRVISGPGGELEG